MGHDLDSLLDVTGIGDMAGIQYEKTASPDAEPFDFKKLAQQCRDAVELNGEVREAKGRALVEKTAAIAVISKTFEEIERITGTDEDKIASTPGVTEFISEALDRGYGPEKIAAVLKEAGVLDSVGGFIRNIGKGRRAGSRMIAGERLMMKGRRQMEFSSREYGSLLRKAVRDGDLNAQRRLVERIRRRAGDREAAKIISKSGAKLHIRDANEILKENARPVATAQVGKKTIGVSGEQMKRYGVPAAAGVGGMAIAGKRDKKRSGGVTVVRS